MSINTEQDPLDSLLAQPAEIADLGFSERIALEIKPALLTRNRLFMGVTIFCMILALDALSPQAIYNELFALIDWNIIVQQLGLLGQKIITLDANTLLSLLPTMLVAVMSVVGVARLLMRN